MRRAAIMALPKVDDGKKTRETLEDLLSDPDPHLRIDVARALGEIGDVKSRGVLRERLELDLDPRARRRFRETLRDLGGDGQRAADQFKEDLDKLQAEHAALKGRVAQLEARGAEAKGTAPAKAGSARGKGKAKSKKASTAPRSKRKS
jgi:aminopeptidase N